MQCKAIFLAALECKKYGFNPIPYIEIPFAGNVTEIRSIKELIENAAI